MSARQTALTILSETESKNGYLNLIFMNAMKKNNSSLDAAFIKELVFGVYRNKLLLDYIIRKHSSLRLKKIEPKVLNALRMGVYQLLFMDKVPPHAAVSESVSLVKKNNRAQTVGFANAVLRSVLRDIESQKNLLPSEENNINYLSIKYSYPETLVSFFIKTFGENAENLMKAGNKTPELCVRVNSLKTTREQLKRELSLAGIESENTPFTDCGLYLFDASEKSRARFSHLFTVQDQSSQLAAIALSPQKNDLVLDLCSAPGGKTTHMAELMENKGEILAFDLYEKRLSGVISSSERLGISIIKTKQADATVLMPELVGITDKILLDVPCSGLGIIRRKPDIKYKENITDFSEILTVQKKILNTAKKYLKPGGIMVYSTCTVNPAENLDMINSFLKENPDFKIDPIKSQHITGEMKNRAETGVIEVFPHTDNSDGFFVCRLKKQK